MHPRAAELIKSLRLEPHPEGGYFREVYRSASRVHSFDGRPERAALTTIYFLLTERDLSRWHQVGSDEVWHHYEGDSVELHMAHPEFEWVTFHRLGPLQAGSQPVHVVPAKSWQAASPSGAYSLVGCTVGPGFEFADFHMLRDHVDLTAALRQRPNELTRFL